MKTIAPPTLLEMSPDELTEMVREHLERRPNRIPGYEVDYLVNVKLREAAVIGHHTGSLVGTVTFTLKEKA